MRTAHQAHGDVPVISLNDLPNYVGREIGVSAWVTIGQREIDDFERITRVYAPAVPKSPDV